MKTNYLTKIAAAGLMTIAPILGGCNSDTGVSVKVLEVSLGHQQTTGLNKESQTPVGQAMFKDDCQPYDDSTISNGAMKSALWKNYQNRNQKK